MDPLDELCFVFHLPAGRFAIAVRCENKAAIVRLGRCYRDYRVENNSTVNIRLSLIHLEIGYRLITPWGNVDINEDVAKANFPNQVEKTNRLDAALEQALISVLCTCDPSLEPFHAACVQKEGLCLALAGMPSSGKTTLALALCLRGWRVVTDDVLLVSLSGGKAIPLRRRAAFRPRPEVLDLEGFWEPGTWVRTQNERFTAGIAQRYLADMEGTYPLTDAILLENFAPQTRLVPLQPAEGLMRFARTAFLPLPTDGASARMMRYAAALGKVRWWSCDLGKPVEAAQILEAAVSGHSSHAIQPGPVVAEVP